MLAQRWTSRLVKDKSSAAWIRKVWDSLSMLPGGSKIYSRLLGRVIPYTGSIKADVLDLEPGFALVQMRDRPSLRNHLGSLHAIALSNLAELTGNAALAASLPDDARFIVTRLDVRYLKKARGTITASCHCPPQLGNEKRELELAVEMLDEDEQLVAKAALYSLVGPTKTST